MQSITELAEEYRGNAERLDRRIRQLKLQRRDTVGQSLYDLNQRIVCYEEMRDSMIATANALAHYYDERR